MSHTYSIAWKKYVHWSDKQVHQARNAIRTEIEDSIDRQMFKSHPDKKVVETRLEILTEARPELEGTLFVQEATEITELGRFF